MRFILADDPALPPPEVAWTPAGIVELFNREILPLARPGRCARDARVEYASYQPRRSCVLLYALSCDGVRERVAVTFAADADLQALFERHYAGPADPAAPPVVLLPERHCVVEFFGHDYGLPVLGLATDRERIAVELAELGVGEWVQTEVLRYRPHHSCILRYACATGSGERREVIGKVYGDAQLAHRVWRSIPHLRGDGHEHGIVIPAGLALLDGSLLLMERIEGEPVKQAFAHAGSSGDVDALITKAAASLAAFHRLRVDEAEPFTLADAVARLQARVAAVAPVVPQFAQRAAEVLARLAQRASSAGPAQPTLIHGDFKPSQMLLAREGVAVVDLDRAGPGDPALDVGNFMAQFQKDALRRGREGLRPLAERFLAEYVRCAGASVAAERSRLGLGLALVRMALRRFERDPHSLARSGHVSRAERLLDEAAALESRARGA